MYMYFLHFHTAIWLCIGKKYLCKLAKQFKLRFDATWWHEVFAEYSRTSDNRPERLIKLPSNEMEKTETSDDYISDHFQDTTLLCSLAFQKQESREMLYTN